MSKSMRSALLAVLVAVFGFGMASSAVAQTHPDCVEDVLDLPALNVCRDAQGLHIMQLPAIGTLREPPPTPTPVVTATPVPDRRLPRTGLNVEDFAAIGMAALAGGAVLIRRLRLAVS